MNLGRENEIVEFKETSGEINEAVIDIVSMLNKHGNLFMVLCKKVQFMNK